jgi:hypothetical protein
MSEVVSRMAKFQSNIVKDAMVHLQHDEVVTRLRVREVLGADLPSYLFDESKTLMENIRLQTSQLRSLIEDRSFGAGSKRHTSLTCWEMGVFLLMTLIVYFVPILALLFCWKLSLFLELPLSLDLLWELVELPKEDNERLSSLQMLVFLGVQMENYPNELSQA